MDRKERTLRALQGLPVDRPPMVFWHHFVGADMEKENFVDSHVRFYRETGEDFIKMMCDGFVALPDLNVQRPCDWRHIALPSMDVRLYRISLPISSGFGKQFRMKRLFFTMFSIRCPH